MPSTSTLTLHSRRSICTVHSSLTGSTCFSGRTCWSRQSCSPGRSSVPDISTGSHRTFGSNRSSCTRWTRFTYTDTTNIVSLFKPALSICKCNLINFEYLSETADSYVQEITAQVLSADLPLKLITYLQVKTNNAGKSVPNTDKSSAVAEMGDRCHNTHGPKKRGGGFCAPFAGSWVTV